jgi:hypothetical protein
MEFSVIQAFPCTPQVYWAATRGAEFDAAIAKEAEVTAEPIESRSEGGHTFDTIRVTHVTPMTLVAQKAFGATHLKYVQEIESIDREFATKWKIVPAFFAERVRCHGVSKVRPTKEGCERSIKGVVEVDVPLVGRLIERQIGEQIQRSYTRAEPVIRRFVTPPENVP